MAEPITAHDYEQHFSDWLKVSNLDLWQRMVGHRFCRDMAEDPLPDCDLDLRFALAKMPSPTGQNHLFGVLNGLVGEQ
jgi:hypothetical protein